MSMTAREDQDYAASRGKFKNEMNEAFDTRGKDAEKYQKMLYSAIESNKQKYEK